MITFGTIGTTSNAGGSTVTNTHTLATTTNNGILIAAILGNGTGNITSLKYAGTAMTKVIAGTQAGAAVESELWYLLNPPAGLGTMNGTFSGTMGAEIDLLSLSYYGVDQTTPILGSARVVGTATGNGSITRTLANVDSFWLGMNALDNMSGSTDVGIQRGTVGNGGEVMVADRLLGTVRFTNTNAASNWVLLGLELVAAPAPRFKNLLGVGI